MTHKPKCIKILVKMWCPTNFCGFLQKKKLTFVVVIGSIADYPNSSHDPTMISEFMVRPKVRLTPCVERILTKMRSCVSLMQ
ncbi:hypothetical protein MtrunA17_Chr5g0426861 [Medicago truncatula]|uniref:Uncharacterized protein n=1 Tax=Medicago truncatula TaxID=3880 RepID=A0A396HUL9_MEDTR|nr:hypothetical protein MtrunA17_Chr5g0426861 [Medicago truncatula]